MRNKNFATMKNGIIELDEMEMHTIHKYYEIQCTADYVRENHEELSEEVIQKIATEVRRQMDKYGFDENEAIIEVMTEMGIETINI